MPLFIRELGIDLGTMNTVVAEGNQIVLQEPTVVAIIVEEQKMVEWGQAAKDMFGRVPESIEVVRPLQHGVIAEYEITEDKLIFTFLENQYISSWKNMTKFNEEDDYIEIYFTGEMLALFHYEIFPDISTKELWIKELKSNMGI